MQEFWFYIQLGLDHVLDVNAYDHTLFLAALAIPFTIKDWKKVLLLATIFTIAHCFSLALATFNVVEIDSRWIEFGIPITILLTAFFNISTMQMGTLRMPLHFAATAFFGLIHGFGFSNFFRMLVAGADEKIGPLLGFATGIELSQILIICFVLAIAYIIQSVLGIKQRVFIVVASVLIVIICVPLIVKSIP